jgi:L-ascorbate metabolism protein UlaG (beta-lactamase superfamily)
MSQIRLLRNATLVITLDGFRFLIDPLLAPKDSYDPIMWTSNNIRNPMTELPVSNSEMQEIIAAADAVIITHTHNDHWDGTARQLIPTDKLLIGQHEDRAKFIEQGFVNVISVDHEMQLGPLKITRTGGQHGTGEIGAMMAPVSGFIIKGHNETIYIAGDTIWCNEVEQAITEHAPTTIVLNAGAAQFDKGDPITMNIDDVLKVCEQSKTATVICVHMEAVNHCYLRRDSLRRAITREGEDHRCLVPEDGESIDL